MSHTPLQILIKVNTDLGADDGHDSCLRTINFMGYELATLCHSKSNQEIFHVLNDFFFNTKNFKLSITPILLIPILAERKGCSIALAFIYMHLAKSLGLELHLIHWPLHAMLKWECDGKSYYVDLEQNGKLLNEEDLLLIINKHTDQVRTLTQHEATLQYLTYIQTHYRQLNNFDLLHKTLCMILTVEPENTRYLAERALLRQEMGLLKDALCDFKRYFSFTDRSAAPELVTAAYDNLLDHSLT